jgi:hypothetical protein
VMIVAYIVMHNWHGKDGRNAFSGMEYQVFPDTCACIRGFLF